jgi:hypothetical protein
VGSAARTRLALGLVLAALAVLPYLRALDSPLLYDDRTLLDNRWLAREAGPVSVLGHDFWFGTKHASSDLYRPLTVLSLAWNMRVAPTRAGIRAGNLALHAIAALVAWWMLLALLRGRPGAAVASWVGAALFAVHPLASEAVLWAVGRAEILAAIFGMTAFVLLLGLDDERLGGWRLALSVGSFLVALLCKESAAAWLAIGAAWLAVRPRRIALVRSVFYLAALGAFLALRGSAVGWARVAPPLLDNPLVHASAIERLANALLLFGRYVGKMLLPVTLSIDYGFDQVAVVPALPWAAPIAALIVAVLVAAIVALCRKGHAAAAFLVAFVPCAFAVTGNFAFPIGTIFAERLAYTPLVGACGLTGLALATIPKPAWRVAIVAALLAGGAARGWVRAGDYRSLQAFSEATVAASPRSVKALVNAGRTRLRLGQRSEGIELLERAVSIAPDYERARLLLDQARAGAPGGADETGSP